MNLSSKRKNFCSLSCPQAFTNALTAHFVTCLSGCKTAVVEVTRGVSVRAFQKKAPLKIIAMYVKMYAAYSDQKGSDDLLPMIYMALVDEEDVPAFEEIYKKYKQELYDLAFRILHNHQDAEDAVQETFIKIADTFTKVLQIPCNELTSYIVIICRNISINKYNKNKRATEHNIRLNENITASEVFSESESKEALMNALSQLPQDHKDVIFLFDLQGLSAKEAAALLGISEGNLRIKVFRARKMLKKLLKGVDPDD